MIENGLDPDAVSALPEADEAGSMEERRRRYVVASEKVRRALMARGVTEDDILRDFEVWRESRRQGRAKSGGPGASAATRS